MFKQIVLLSGYDFLCKCLINEFFHRWLIFCFNKAELGVKDRYLKNIEDGRSLSTEAITRHFIVLSKLFGISITDLAAMEALYQVANIELIDTMSNEPTKSSIDNVD